METSVIVGIVYDAVFVLLVLAVAYGGMRRGFVSGLLRLGGSVVGIIAGVAGVRQWAEQLYVDHLGVAIGERIRDTVTEYGDGAAEALAELPFLPEALQRELISIVNGAADDMVPRIVNALQPVFLPIIQAMLFLVICLLVHAAARILERALRSINYLPVLGSLNKMLGFALGFVAGLLDCWLLAMALWAGSAAAMGRLPFLTQEMLSHSALYGLFANFNPFAV